MDNVRSVRNKYDVYAYIHFLCGHIMMAQLGDVGDDEDSKDGV